MKIEVDKLPFINPLPICLVGVYDQKANFNTLGNVGIISMSPPVVYISSHKSHYTNQVIDRTGYFSLNMPSADQMKETDYCGLVSGKETNKDDLFAYDVIDASPLIKSCPISMTVKVLKKDTIYDMDVYYGQVLHTYVDDSAYVNGVLMMDKLNPLIYGMDNCYYKIGPAIGVGFREGHK